MGIDQYGNCYHGLEYPRRDLLKSLNAKTAYIMYQDTIDGKTYRVGYIIKGLWITLYKVTPVRWYTDIWAVRSRRKNNG